MKSIKCSFACLLIFALFFILSSAICASDFLLEDGEGVVFYPSRSTYGIDITLQPSSVTCFKGDNISFSFEATGYSSSQWWYSRDGGVHFYRVFDSDRFSGATSSTLVIYDVPSAYDGWIFACNLTNSSGTLQTNRVSITIQLFNVPFVLSWLGTNLFNPLFSFSTPWGIAFGAVVVGVFGAPLLVRAYRKFF